MTDDFINSPVTDKPYRSNRTGFHEWYTPPEIIEAARAVMGSIDLDPASCELADAIVKAGKYYTIEDDGPTMPWYGNVFLNPPYATKIIVRFIDALIEKRHDYKQAIVLVNNATETKWFRQLVSLSSAIVFPTGRVKFYMPDQSTGSPLQGQAITYIGDNTNKFLKTFQRFGWGALL